MLISYTQFTIRLIIVVMFVATRYHMSFGIDPEVPATSTRQNRMDSISLVLEICRNRELQDHLSLNEVTIKLLRSYCNGPKFSGATKEFFLTRHMPPRMAGLRFYNNEIRCRTELMEIIGAKGYYKAKFWQNRYRNTYSLDECFLSDYIQSICGLTPSEFVEYKEFVASKSKRKKEIFEEIKKGSSLKLINAFPEHTKHRIALYFGRDDMISNSGDSKENLSDCPFPIGTKGTGMMDIVSRSFRDGNPLRLDSSQVDQIAVLRKEILDSYSAVLADNSKPSSFPTKEIQQFTSKNVEEAWEALDPVQQRRLAQHIAWMQLCNNPRALFKDPLFVRYVGYKNGVGEWQEFDKTFKSEREFVSMEATRLQGELFDDVAEFFDPERRQMFEFAFMDGW